MIRRSERKTRFTVVNNDVIEDDRLSFKAKGLLVYLLSKPDNWTANEEHLSGVGVDGTTAIRSALKELKNTGYLVIESERNDDGTIKEWHQVIYEEPQSSDGGEVAEDGPDNGKPDGEEPRMLKTHDLDNTPIINTEVTITKNNNNGNNLESDDSGPTYEAPELNDWQKLVANVTFCVHGHANFSILPYDGSTGQGAIQRESKIIKDAGYTYGDVNRWWKEVWLPRYSWTTKNGSVKRPTPVEVRAGIPAINPVNNDQQDMNMSEKVINLPPTLRNIANMMQREAAHG